MPLPRRRRCGSRIVIAAAVAAVLSTAACSDTEREARTTAEVTVPADGLELTGTLRLPAGPGPHPGAVIAHGSGPHSRRGLVPGQLGLGFPAPVPVHEQLGEGLRDAGFAVLTFDKRSCGSFNGCAANDYPVPPDDLTFDTFVDDVDRMLEHLAQRADIDRTVLVGHSKGGTIAATLAASREDLDAVVLLATPAPPIDEVLTTQAETFADLVDAAGQASQPAAARQVDGLRTLASTVSEIAEGQIDGAPVDGVPRSFWVSWIDASRAAPEQLETGTAPVLVLGGSNDWNVPPDQVEAWASVLDDTDELRILPGMTHALTRLEVADPAAITPSDVGTSVDEQLVAAIVDWLHARFD